MINGQLLHGITSSAGEIGFNELEFPPYYAERFPLTFRDQVMFGQILTDANFIEGYRRARPEYGRRGALRRFHRAEGRFSSPRAHRQTRGDRGHTGSRGISPVRTLRTAPHILRAKLSQACRDAGLSFTGRGVRRISSRRPTERTILISSSVPGAHRRCGHASAHPDRFLPGDAGGRVPRCSHAADPH
jgi:hypothetical protein